MKRSRDLAVAGMMTALVFVSNYLRVTMPIAIGGRTSFTLANVMCCLAGLLLGPAGGAASGLGSALYDLTNPVFAAECWITLITKGVMGAAAGAVMGPARREPAWRRAFLASAAGCAAYYVLYFFKCFAYDGLLLERLPVPVALGILPLKLPASVFNAAVALILAPPLCVALRRALVKAHLDID